MKLLNIIVLIFIAGIACLFSCTQTKSNIITGSFTSNNFSGNNCIAVSYNKTVEITGGNFIGTNTKNSLPIVIIDLLNYQSTAPFTYAMDGEISHFNTFVYETTTDTFSAYNGTLTINTILPTITGTFSVTLTNICQKDTGSHKDTITSSGSFIAPGL